MITTTSKPANMSIRPAITLPAPALIVALVLATVALVLPAGASAQTPDANSMSRLYEGCAPQLHVSKLEAAKPDGEKQPLDLSIELTDEYGNHIEGAKVMARATDFETHVDAPLTDLGNGLYASCAFGYFNGSGEGAVYIHVRAEKSDHRPGAGDGSNTVGSLCALPGAMPPR